MAGGRLVVSTRHSRHHSHEDLGGCFSPRVGIATIVRGEYRGLVSCHPAWQFGREAFSRHADLRCHSSPRNVAPVASTSYETAVDAVDYAGIEDGAVEESSNGVVAGEKNCFLPSDYVLGPGELSYVDRTGLGLPEDEYQEPPDGSVTWRRSQNGYLLEILKARVYDIAIQSPLEEAPTLSAQLGNRLLLKREDLQPVFSFKLRGAYNKMSNLTAEAHERGVICSSAGNHAQGVALSARHLGCSAIICMPTTTPTIKVEAVKRLGGVVELVGESYQETQEYAMAKAQETGREFIAPYDDPYTVAGQGTIGKEILEQCQAIDDLEAVFVAIGGGGLIAGIGMYLKALRPEVKVIGVEPAGANAMAMSLAKGYRVRLSTVDAFADGVAVKQVGKETFRLCQQVVDGVILVDNTEISAAIKNVYNETRSILEPAGAVSVAGAKAYALAHGIKGKALVAVTSGANINFSNLRLVADLADIGAKREAVLATSIPELPGEFQRFMDIALEGTDLMVTECKYRFSAGSEAHILWSVGLTAALQLRDLLDRLNGSGFRTLDVSSVDEVQGLMRDFVGGRPRCYMGQIPHERVYKVRFPERVGALHHFLQRISPRWNVTMFCYRKSGNQATGILLGLQVPPQEEEVFQDAMNKLKDFTFRPISDEAQMLYKIFLQ